MTDSPRQPTEAELADTQRMVASMTHAIVALGGVGQEEAVRAVVGELQTQPEVDKVLQDAISGENREKYAEWGVTFHTKEKSNVLNIGAPKDGTKIDNVNDLLFQALLLGLVTQPTVRAMLVAAGYRLEFWQRVQAPAKPLIIS